MKKMIGIIACFALMQSPKAQDFDVQKLKTVKKFDWSGSLGASTSFYNTTGTQKQSNPFTYAFNGNVNIRIMEVLDLPFSFNLTKYQSSFTKPTLQFGLSPSYKWIKVHIGNRNLTFNPYTLAGHSFLGGGIELTPKKFRFAAMYGRLKPAIEVDINNQVTIPSFARRGYGAKIGYGDENNFIDLIYFHAEDDANSIKNWMDPNVQEQMGDANLLLPRKNNVVGVSGKTTWAKKFVMTVEGGLSFYNPNTADAEINPKIDKIDLSSRLKWAGKTTMGYSFPNTNLKLEYERILPNYITLGSYFFNTDMENIVFSPSGTLAKGKLVYQFSAGMQKNNLDESKTETTKRFIANASLSINPAPLWGMDINYNNFAINQLPGTMPIKDSVRLRQVNQTVTVSPRLSFVKDSSATHTISLSANYNDVNDKNIVTQKYGNMQAMMLALNHVSSFTRRGNSINTGLNYNNTKMADAQNTQYGATVGYTQSFFKNKLNSNINVNYNKSYVNDLADGAVINGTLTMGCTAGKRHAFSLSLNIIKTTSKQFENYIESLGTIGYTLRLK